MTLQNKSLQPENTVSKGSEYQQSLSADDPILVSPEGTYQQEPIKLGNDKWIFLAAKIRNTDINKLDKITTLFVQQAQILASRPKSLPLDQLTNVQNVGGDSPDIALFGIYKPTTGERAWFHIRYAPNTGRGRPGGSISYEINCTERRCGDWYTVRIVHNTGEDPFLYFNYADDDNNGITGSFSLTPANPGGGCRTG